MMTSPLITSDRPKPARQTGHLRIGCLVFPRMDQIDFTGPFEILSRIPDVTVAVVSKALEPIRDVQGLIFTPEITIADAPPFDVLLVPGGYGQQSLMKDEAVLSFIRSQYYSGRIVFAVCTGALLCGAAGILRGREATTHWAAWNLIPHYGALPRRARVVVDGNLVTAAGVTAGIDAALVLTSLLRDQSVAEKIQLAMEYAPEPIFHSGTPDTAPANVITMFENEYGQLRASREADARLFAKGSNA